MCFDCFVDFFNFNMFKEFEVVVEILECIIKDLKMVGELGLCMLIFEMSGS